MDPFTHNHNPTPGLGPDPEPDDCRSNNSSFSASLRIHIHHARNIHNICIYDDQDVYAKFSLTYNPDETTSTSVVPGGGKNPNFDQTLSVKVNQPDSVLKCEMWMLSRARNYMEDQLLGFALVPLSEVIGKSNVTSDYTLSSTDLFHSPAGSVRLTLSLDSVSIRANPLPVNSSSISSEVVLLDNKVDLDRAEYSRIEFPDINVAAENHQMVSEYFTSSSPGNNSNDRIASFLHLGSCTIDQNPVFDYGIPRNFPENNNSVSPEHNNSAFSSSPDSIEKKGILVIQEPSNSSNPEGKSKPIEQGKEIKHGNPNEGDGTEGQNNNNAFRQVFTANNIEAENSVMQQQIVGMYMRSMQQFTESLAKMKLPMDLDKIEREEKTEIEQIKKDGSRVFYGSRAFF